ncbi:MAG: polysaccharide deacetylase family protein, partial [Mycobacteriaceae bacterium]
MLRRPLALILVALVVAGCGRAANTAGVEPVDCAVDKCVALTFDDGPTPFTDRLLTVLNDAGAKATFFMIGNKVAANPTAAKRVAAAGMEIGNHTWEHPNMTTIP